MSNNCGQILRVWTRDAERESVANHLISNGSTGLVHPLHGDLPPLAAQTSWPQTICMGDDGDTLWVFWQTRRAGPLEEWCAKLSHFFPQAVVTLHYVYEWGGDSARLVWCDGELVDVEDFFNPSDELESEAIFHRLELTMYAKISSPDIA